MFGADFGEKCIMMHFLGGGKNGKDKISQRSPEVSGSGAEFAEKEQRKPRDPGTAHTDGVIASTEPVLR